MNEKELPGPGPELDALVAERLGLDLNLEDDEFIPFSTDIKYSMPLMVKYKLSLAVAENGSYLCGAYDWENGEFKDGYVVGKTTEHAICLAFLALPDEAVK